MTALLLSLLLGAPDAGVETQLRVEGDLVTAGSFGVKELMALMPSPIEWTDKKGNTRAAVFASTRCCSRPASTKARWARPSTRS